MLLHLLGTAAGGGFPQWNCHCANCRGVRAGTHAPARDGTPLQRGCHTDPKSFAALLETFVCPVPSAFIVKTSPFVL